MTQDVYEVTSYEQAKVLTNKVRMRIFDLMDDFVPRTSKQISEKMGLPPNKVHYHVQELVRVGLFTLVETREKGGVIEKYYLPIAKQIRIRLNEQEDSQEGRKSARYRLTKALLDEHREGLLKSLEFYENQSGHSEDEKLTMTSTRLRIHPNRVSEFKRELQQWIQEWHDKYDEEEEDTFPTWRLLIAAHLEPDDQGEGQS